MQSKHYLAFALALGLIIGAALWLALAPHQAQAPSQGATTTTAGADGTTIEGNGTGTVAVSSASAIKPPALHAPLFAAGTSANVKQAAQIQYQDLSGQLKTAPTRVDLWLKLGVLYKIAGDYQGAIDAWTYVAKAGPGNINFIAYGDLGDLYLNFLQDYPNAKAAYQAALAVDPGNAMFKAGLAQAQAQLTE